MDRTRDGPGAGGAPALMQDGVRDVVAPVVVYDGQEVVPALMHDGACDVVAPFMARDGQEVAPALMHRTPRRRHAGSRSDGQNDWKSDGGPRDHHHVTKNG